MYMLRGASTVVAVALLAGGASSLRTTRKSADNDGDGLDDNFEMSCAQKFKPVVYLHSDEPYGPGRVEDFLKNCALRRRTDCWGSLLEQSEGQGANTSRAFCPWGTAVTTRQAGCFFKDKDEDLGKATVDLIAKYKDSDNLYLRCLNCLGTKCDDMGMDRTEAVGTHGEAAVKNVPFYIHVFPDSRSGSGRIQIQYWFFYPFNGPTMGFGPHQGDWEHISIIVDSTCSKRLKYQSFSHGKPSGWFDEGTGDAQFENGKLVAYSGIRSHASFMTEGEHEGGTIVTKDYTNKGTRWNPDELVNLGETTCAGSGRKPMSAATAFVDFGGRWGTDSTFDGVLGGSVFKSLCPGGPHYQFNQDSGFTCRSR